MGEIKNAGVYYNEALPTYNSNTCITERESSAGGAVGGSVVGALCCLACCGGIIWFFFFNNKARDTGNSNVGTPNETAAVDAQPQTTTTTMMV